MVYLNNLESFSQNIFCYIDTIIIFDVVEPILGSWSEWSCNCTSVTQSRSRSDAEWPQVCNSFRYLNCFYHPRMRVGNVFGCVCLSACLSVCPSVQATAFKLLHIETSFLVCRYIFTISRSSLSIKVLD